MEGAGNSILSSSMPLPNMQQNFNSILQKVPSPPRVPEVVSNIQQVVENKLRDGINLLSSPEGKQQRDYLISTLLYKVFDPLNGLAKKCCQEWPDLTTVKFSYTVAGVKTKFSGTLPSWATSAPTWALSGIRVYWLLYRDASWKFIFIGFVAGAILSATVPKTLDALNIKKYVDYDRITSPELLHLADLGVFLFTLIFSSRPAALALGWQLGKQAANLLPKKKAVD